MNGRSLVIASGIAGFVMALLSTLPVVYLGNCLACMWLWPGGILGAWIYRRSQPNITSGQGAVIGLLAGIVGALLAAVLGTVFGGAGLSSLLASQTNNAQELFGGAAGSLLAAGAMSLLGLLFNVFIFPIFGAIGGAIGGVVFGRPAPSV